MKLSKTLLGTIAVSISMGSFTSCSDPADISALNPTSTIETRLERGESIEGQNIVYPENFVREVCNTQHSEDCPPCGMG